MKKIPNLFTLLNLVFGCVAIIYILQNGITALYNPDGSQYISMPEKTTIASFCIGMAAVVDFLDGLVARLFKATSPMGKQLDSLADLVSFGVAPGMILYQLLRLGYSGQADGIDVSLGWLLPALIFPCAAAYRLARFNLDESQTYGFKGVPTPAAGILIASLPLISWYSQNPDIAALIINKWVLYGIIVVVAWLMTSNLPLMALKFKDNTMRGNWPKLLLVGIGVVSAVVLKWVAVPVVFVFYIIVSLVAKNRTS
ncbi:MAG TPA: CDP-alcohol phosphatidyltransferase family protein [Puia sp.]|jgi:CDP-diacylglycerol--serine O-phosphatidyltransferase|nr:CDP-alcohol phosphatidyltransferase family protein [Puia sp.]